MSRRNEFHTEENRLLFGDDIVDEALVYYGTVVKNWPGVKINGSAR